MYSSVNKRILLFWHVHFVSNKERQGFIGMKGDKSTCFLRYRCGFVKKLA